jgi:hypothetical protein
MVISKLMYMLSKVIWADGYIATFHDQWMALGSILAECIFLLILIIVMSTRNG